MGWKLHTGLLLLWVAIGAALRFANLEAKSLWSDEISTLVFSLGNSVLDIPLNQAIDLQRLLLPLHPRSIAGIGDVLHYLRTESNHPPTYFVLAHLWLRLFPSDNLVSVAAARSLPALLGVGSIPAIAGLGWLAFRSGTVAHLAAALMAVSPFGVYLAQEARHYTLGILLIIASLACLVVASRSIHKRLPLPTWLCLTWVGINGLGLAVHYFFALTLGAEALVLLGLLGWNKWRGRSYPFWWQLGAVGLGTAIAALTWLPFGQGTADGGLTHWIYKSDSINRWLWSIGRVFVWLVSMVTLLPVEDQPLPVTIASGIVLLGFVGWLLPVVVRGLRLLLQEPATRNATQTLAGFVLAAIGLFLAIANVLGADLTVAVRYHFVYFPAVLLLLGAILALCWNHTPNLLLGRKALRFLQARGKLTVVLVLLLGTIASSFVVTNQVFQKPHRADLLAREIQTTSQVPVLIAMTNGNDLRFREMIALGYEFLGAPVPPRFLLVNVRPNPGNTIVLERTIAQLPRPLDIWTVNYSPDAVQGCTLDSQHNSKVNGYRYRRFQCRG